jgi:hypothetical protein
MFKIYSLHIGPYSLFSVLLFQPLLSEKKTFEKTCFIRPHSPLLDLADTRGESKNICYGLKKTYLGPKHERCAFIYEPKQQKFYFFPLFICITFTLLLRHRFFLSFNYNSGNTYNGFSDHSAVNLKIVIQNNQLVTTCERGYWKQIRHFCQTMKFELGFLILIRFQYSSIFIGSSIGGVT